MTVTPAERERFGLRSENENIDGLIAEIEAMMIEHQPREQDGGSEEFRDLLVLRERLKPAASKDLVAVLTDDLTKWRSEEVEARRVAEAVRRADAAEDAYQIKVEKRREQLQRRSRWNVGTPGAGAAAGVWLITNSESIQADVVTVVSPALAALVGTYLAAGGVILSAVNFFRGYRSQRILDGVDDEDAQALAIKEALLLSAETYPLAGGRFGFTVDEYNMAIGTANEKSAILVAADALKRLVHKGWLVEGRLAADNPRSVYSVRVD